MYETGDPAEPFGPTKCPTLIDHHHAPILQTSDDDLEPLRHIALDES